MPQNRDNGVYYDASEYAQPEWVTSFAINVDQAVQFLAKLTPRRRQSDHDMHKLATYFEQGERYAALAAADGTGIEYFPAKAHGFRELQPYGYVLANDEASRLLPELQRLYRALRQARLLETTGPMRRLWLFFISELAATAVHLHYTDRLDMGVVETLLTMIPQLNDSDTYPYLDLPLYVAATGNNLEPHLLSVLWDLRATPLPLNEEGNPDQEIEEQFHRQVTRLVDYYDESTPRDDILKTLIGDKAALGPLVASLGSVGDEVVVRIPTMRGQIPGQRRPSFAPFLRSVFPSLYP
ncbi:hypothetical protein IWQ60_007625 [Tieghemiomyces parasiticus]|uniref:Uncharacterized protein n=1 Tax=Tieghemiomyces parasiticus TaxID=78921 RepID=A0A9W7ZWA9_9FUNG|nr:hypothetical protein IWQ60_007625 [Tieghemiomyces parasiticus]